MSASLLFSQLLLLSTKKYQNIPNYFSTISKINIINIRKNIKHVKENKERDKLKNFRNKKQEVFQTHLARCRTP